MVCDMRLRSNDENYSHFFYKLLYEFVFQFDRIMYISTCIHISFFYFRLATSSAYKQNWAKVENGKYRIFQPLIASIHFFGNGGGNGTDN